MDFLHFSPKKSFWKKNVLMKVISINLLLISVLYLCVKFKTTPAKTKAFNKCRTTTNSSKHSQLELWQEIRVWIRARQKQLTKCTHSLLSSRNLELHSCSEKQYLQCTSGYTHDLISPKAFKECIKYSHRQENVHVFGT